LKEKFIELVRITKKLRSEEGCPWDREQTLESLRSHIVEESYEVIEAIDLKDYNNLKEELGDLLLQILLISNIAEEQNLFSLEDVIGTHSRKLIRRHPHVFGERVAKNADEAKKIWNEEKVNEKNNEKDRFSKSFPSLIRAVDISNNYSKLDLDWESSEELLEVLFSEIKEYQEAIKKKNRLLAEEEIGDILFTVANLCRKEKINPEIALNKSSDKFLKRAKIFINLKKNINNLSDEEIWKKAKLLAKESS
jgi:tetrapyrrole methylase family protein/MazG family protein|tara:strand:+ start:491 stop:1243 length:753 start_codon:yes stop_codon:yes gene_type:complete